ncbi:MAG TPA: hypothetical protein VNJ04_14730, partial [Gemmatimonadaceae bacterium]|nr:hypothetical protein [Gemmatimonadaceae bacterium]
AKQPDLVAIRSFEPTASFTLQLAVCQLAIVTVNLDAMVRYLTGQPPRDHTLLPADDIAFRL